MAQLRWIGIAVISFLMILGGGWLRKAIAFSLCGLLSFNQGICLTNHRVLAIESPAEMLQVSNKDLSKETKTEDYFSPLQKDGTPKLGIDRWWATAGVDKEITVNWTVEIKEKGEYYLRLGVDLENFDVIKRFRKWKLSDKVSIKISDDYNRPVSSYEASGYDDKISIRFREPGIYRITIDKFVVPQEAVVEEIKFKLNKLHKGELGEDIYLKTLFIADRPETNSQYLLKIQEADKKIFKTKILVSKSQLINYFTPILNFEPEEEYQVPFDVNKNTWQSETKANIKDRGNADDYLDLSQFKTNIKGTYSRSKKTPAKIYASIVENDNLEIDNKKTGIKELAINYYFHYPYSNWYDHKGFNNHEGDWEGITVFLRKDRDGYYYPCRVAFGEHIFLVSELLSEGGEMIEWTKLVKNNNILFSSNSDVFLNNSGSRNDILAQPNVFVSLGGHASYPNSGINELSFCTKFKIPTSIDFRCEEKHRGGKIYNLHDNLSLISSSEPQSREVVEYLPRVGKGINAKEMQGKEWLLYPGTWGNPKQCKNIFGTCLDAPRGPVFLDLKKISGISQPISKIDGITWESFGLGERWLNPWKWSETFAGADKIKDCPPPKEEPKPEPSPEVSQKPDGSTGSVFGDPHIVTLDGLRNSFQAAGEFILAQSKDGNFEVQTRFAPVGKNASLTTAVAVKIGSDRIGIYPGNLLRINSQRSNLADGSVLSLQGGGRLLRQGNNYTIFAPTGEFLQVSGGSSLTVNLTVPKNRRGTIRGLMGNYNGKAEDDLQTRDGKSLPTNPSYDQLYKVFGKSWRISQDESLFDYGAGETTATFTMLDFPQKVLTLADFSVQQKQEAEKVCRSAGVTNAALLESCMFDVLVTGDRSFANISAYVQSKVNVTANVTPLVEQKKPTITTETQKPSSINSFTPTSTSNYVFDYSIQVFPPPTFFENNTFRHIAFSPDSKQLFVADNSCKITIWNSVTGKLERTLNPPPGGCSIISPDNKLTASFIRDRDGFQFIKIWNLTTGKLVRIVNLGRFTIYNFVFNPDSNKLAIGKNGYNEIKKFDECIIEIWNLASGKLEHTIKRKREFGNDNLVTFFIPNNNRLIADLNVAKMRIWNLASGKVERIFEDIDSDAHQIAFSPDGKRAAVTDKLAGYNIYDVNSQGDIIKLWNLTTGKLEFTFKTNYERGGITIYSLAFSPDSKRLVGGTESRINPKTNQFDFGNIKIWNTLTGELENTLNTRNDDDISNIVFSPDGKKLATASKKGVVYVWKTKE